MINKLSEEIHAINVKNGFYEDQKNIGEMLCLVHSEISEALEADRKNRYANLERFTEIEPTINDQYEGATADEIWKDMFERYIKDSFEDELADAMIRIMDLAKLKGIDLEAHIKAKMRYNSMREYKHGKKY